MDINDEVVQEIGEGLLSNEVFINALAIRLAEILQPETILKSKPSKLKTKIQENHKKIVLTTLKDVYDDYQVIEVEDMEPLLIELLVSKPTEGDYYPIAPFIKIMGPLILHQDKITTWNRSKITPAICAGAMARLNFIQPTDGSDEYGYPYYKIIRRICKNIRSIRIPRLPLYQKLILKHFEDLTRDIEAYKLYLQGDETSSVSAIKLVEKEPDTVGYTDFLDHISILEEDDLYDIKAKIDATFI